MSTNIKVDGLFLRYGDTVLARAGVADVNLNNGHILMHSGKIFAVPPAVARAWFSDQIDYAEQKVQAACAAGGENAKVS